MYTCIVWNSTSYTNLVRSQHIYMIEMESGTTVYSNPGMWFRQSDRFIYLHNYSLKLCLMTSVNSHGTNQSYRDG